MNIEKASDDDWDDYDRVTAVQPHTKGTCIECKSPNVVADRTNGHTRCIDCDTCFGQILDNGVDWGIYEESTSTEVARCGFVTSHFFPKSSMRTSTACGGNRSLQIIGRNDQMPYDEYSLLNIFETISNICLKNRLTKAIVENTKLIYYEIHKRKIIIRKRHNRYGMYGACTFYGASIQHSYRSIKEIATMYGVQDADITTACNKLHKHLIDTTLLSSLAPTSPLDFIDRFCYRLKFNKEQIKVIRKITANASKLYLTSSHQPMSIATSCVLLYMTIHNIMYPTKKMVLETFNITSVTSDKIYNKMFPFRHVIIDDDITEMVYQEFKESKFIAVDEELHDKLNEDMDRIRHELYENNKGVLEKYDNLKTTCLRTKSNLKLRKTLDNIPAFEEAKQYVQKYKKSDQPK